MNGYPEPRVDFWARVNIDVQQEERDIPDFDSGVMVSETTGRVRVVIEGEKELVYALMGRNFTKRCRKVMESIDA